MWKGRFKTETAELLKSYSESVSFDWRLYRYDIAGSIAHAAALAQAGLISEPERKQIAYGLTEIGASMGEAQINVLIDIVAAALQRNYPEMTPDKVENLLDLGNASAVLNAVLTGSGLKALILPAVTLGLFQMTLIMRLVRSEMLEVLRTDYIKFARARGLSNPEFSRTAAELPMTPQDSA